MTDIPLLNVPVWVKAGDAGVTMAELKSIFRSYEITFRFVRSPTVIGTEISPGVAITAGNVTVTPANDCGGELMSVLCISPDGCEKIGAILLFKPKNSAVESIKAVREPAAPNDVMLISRAMAITTKLSPINR